MKTNTGQKLLRILLPTVSHYSIHYVFTFITVLNALLFSAVGADRMFRGLLQFWARMLFWSMGRRVIVKNREYIEAGKSYLVVMNHSSMFDIPAIMSVIPDGAWIGRDKLLNIPVFGILLRRNNYIPIDTSSWRNSLEAIATASRNSSNGLTVLIFPEGTRTVDGNIQNFTRGFIKIMRSTGVDILPVTINGLFTWKSKYQRHINTSEPLEIVVNRPVAAQTLMSKSDDEIITAVKSIIESSYRPTGGEE